MVALLLAWWLVPIAAIGIVYLFDAWVLTGYGYHNDIAAWLYTCIVHGNSKWWILLIWLAVSAVIAGLSAVESENAGSVLVAGATAIAAIVSLVLGITFEVNLDKNAARYYTTSTTFYVKDVNKIPSSLNLLKGDGASKTEQCDLQYKGKNDDSFGCIKQGDLPVEGWDPRVGSHTVAVHALKSTSGDRQGVSLDERTVTYLNGKRGVWSGILDGSDINNPLGGVAEWSGRGVAKECRFEGDYGIDRAFAGGRSKSLTNLYNERFPMLRYEMTDVWGFCKSHGEGKPEEPIIVIPVKMPVPYSHRTVDAAAGIVTVRGDHGNTVLEYKPDVKAGEYPGPVYSESLVVEQRNQSFWAGGRENHNRNHFGFEPVDTEVQAGNISEYLLMEHETGRLQYVTPLRLRGSGSELFVAYAVTYADEVHRGRLNELSIYVLNDNDPRRVALNILLSSTDQWLTNNAPFARINGGKLQEFVPIDGDRWRAYIENETQVSYLVDLKNSDLNNPKLTPMNGAAPAVPSPNSSGSSPIPGAVPSGPVDCNNLAAETPKLWQCVNGLMGELQKRTATTPPK